MDARAGQKCAPTRVGGPPVIPQGRASNYTSGCQAGDSSGTSAATTRGGAHRAKSYEAEIPAYRPWETPTKVRQITKPVNLLLKAALAAKFSMSKPTSEEDEKARPNLCAGAGDDHIERGPGPIRMPASPRRARDWFKRIWPRHGGKISTEP